MSNNENNVNGASSSPSGSARPSDRTAGRFTTQDTIKKPSFIKNIPPGLRKAASDAAQKAQETFKSFMPSAFQPSKPDIPQSQNENTENTSSFDADSYISKYEEGSFLNKALKGFLEGFKKQGKTPTKAQMEAIKESFETLQKDENFTKHPNDIQKKVFEEVAKEVAKDGSDNIDINSVAEHVINKSEAETELANKNQKILDELKSCFKDDNGKFNFDKKNRILIDKDKLQKIKENLSKNDKEKYDALVEKLEPNMKNINDDTAHLHFALLSSVKTGADLSELKSNNDPSKTLLEELEESTKEAIKGTGTNAMGQEQFCDNLAKIFGKDAIKSQLKDTQKQTESLKPANDQERKKLEEQMVGDGKLYSQDEWDKMSDSDKEKAYAAQKHENQIMEKLQPELRQQLENMPPKERRNALEKMMGNQPLGTPQAMQNMKNFNQMTPEMQKNLMDKWKEAVQANQDAMQGQHDMQKDLIDKRFKSFKDNIDGMAKGISDATSALQGLASSISQMRQSLLRQAEQRLSESQNRQEQMMREHGRKASRGDGYH